MKKILFALLSSFFIFHSTFVFSAAEDDAFIADKLPAQTIASSSEPELGKSEPLVLADGAEYLAIDNMDISGAMLGMSFDDIYTLFFKTKTLYQPRKENSLIYTIANDWRYNLDYECRQQKVYVPAELEKCILSLARARGLLYASELHLLRPSTGETIDIYFTSNATDNKVWKIVYQNDVNELEGANAKFENQREKKILSFWQNILEKYGAPNNLDGDKWISSDNSFDPMMIAYYGKLELTDLGFAGRDAALNVKQSKENFSPKPYSF